MKNYIKNLFFSLKVIGIFGLSTLITIFLLGFIAGIEVHYFFSAIISFIIFILLVPTFFMYIDAFL